MALVNCPDCGRDVSSRATACPSCGYPVSADQHPDRPQSKPSENKKSGTNGHNVPAHPLAATRPAAPGAQHSATRAQAGSAANGDEVNMTMLAVGGGAIVVLLVLIVVVTSQQRDRSVVAAPSQARSAAPLAHVAKPTPSVSATAHRGREADDFLADARAILPAIASKFSPQVELVSLIIYPQRALLTVRQAGRFDDYFYGGGVFSFEKSEHPDGIHKAHLDRSVFHLNEVDATLVPKLVADARIRVGGTSNREPMVYITRDPDSGLGITWSVQFPSTGHVVYRRDGTFVSLTR